MKLEIPEQVKIEAVEKAGAFEPPPHIFLVKKSQLVADIIYDANVEFKDWSRKFPDKKVVCEVHTESTKEYLIMSCGVKRE